MLQAMNTGHEGSLSTCHANGPDDALRRLETMVLMAEVGLPLAAVREQIAASLDLVVHVARGPDGRRRVVAVAEVVPPDRARHRSAPGRWPTRRRGRSPARRARRVAVDAATGRSSLGGAARDPGRVLALRHRLCWPRRSRAARRSAHATSCAGHRALRRLVGRAGRCPPRRGAGARWPACSDGSAAVVPAAATRTACPSALDHVAAAVRAGASTDGGPRRPPPRSRAVRSPDRPRRRRRGRSNGARRWRTRSTSWCRGRPLPAGRAHRGRARSRRRGSVGRQAARDRRDRRHAPHPARPCAREVRALSAQARASAVVMSVTPFVFAAVAAALDPRVAGLLLGRARSAGRASPPASP